MGATARTPQAASQLFVVDPIERLRPAKDSSVALMQAAQRAGQQVWVCTIAELAVEGERAAAASPGCTPLVRARPVTLAPMHLEGEGWQVPAPWFSAG